MDKDELRRQITHLIVNYPIGVENLMNEIMLVIDRYSADMELNLEVETAALMMTAYHYILAQGKIPSGKDMTNEVASMRVAAAESIRKRRENGQENRRDSGRSTSDS